MAGQSKGVSFIRRLSIFYFLLAALGAFFAFYYLKFIPGNKAELEKRGFRALNMFSNNIIARNNDIINIINHAGKMAPGAVKQTVDVNDSVQLITKSGFYGQFNSLYPYSIEKPASDSVTGFSIQKSSREDWAIYYTSPYQKIFVKIAPGDIIGRSLTGNAETFDSYILLKQAFAAKNDYDIVYDQNSAATSTILNLDTLGAKLKNSDQTAIIDMNLSGANYKMFLNPFNIGSQKLVLVGLMTKQNYNRQANYAPVGNTVLIVMLILVIIISLPFIKLFTLSAREKIAFADVVGTAISIFAGSALIIMILTALFINDGLNKINTDKLKTIGSLIKTDVENEIAAATAQLNEYDTKFNKDSARIMLDVLSAPGYANASSAITKRIDSAFFPSIYKNIYRAFWITAQGKTIAKWNPFNFYAPLTDVAGQHYFKMLSEQDRNDNTYPVALYPDISNVTGEFQVFAAKRVNPKHAYISPGKDSAAYLAISTFFNTSIQPVLPKDFGFCIIDNNTGGVLMHSDSKRNLQENIFDETEHNDLLLQSIRYKTAAGISDIQLYGSPHTLYSMPVAGQPISLVVFYDKNSLYNSVFRIAYFAAEMLFYIYCCIAICIIWYSLKNRTTSKLNFALVSTEWFRPSQRNALSYFFTKKYFGGLLVLSVSFLTLNIMLNWDSRNIFCLCVLLPMFTLLGFVTSRNKDKILHAGSAIKNEPTERVTGTKNPIIFYIKKYYINAAEVIKNSVLVFLLLLLVTVFIGITVYHTGFYGITYNKFFFSFFSVMIFFILCANFYNTYRPANIKKYITERKEHEKEYEGSIKAAYRVSLFRGMLLIGIIPAMGILYYAFTAESVQQKKYEELSISTAFQNRSGYIRHKIIENYKPLYLADTLFTKYLTDTLTTQKGIYTGRFDSVPVKAMAKTAIRDAMPDQPYGFLMSNYSVLAYYNNGNYFINDKPADNTWRFDYYDTTHGKLMLTDNRGDNPVVVKATNLFANFSGFTPSSFVIFLLLPAVILCALGFLCWYLFGQIMRRLFLVDYFPNGECQGVNENYLKQIFDHHSPWEEGTFNIANTNVPQPANGWAIAFNAEKNFLPVYKPCTQEDYILANTFYFDKLFKKIWGRLTMEEQYLLYDLAFDNYTNYKDVTSIYLLLNKGILLYHDLRLEFFSYSFKNFVLSKKGSDEIAVLKAQIATPGVWEALRTPILILIVITGMFLFITQSDLSHQITAVITAAAAVIPLFMKLTEKLGGNAADKK